MYSVCQKIKHTRLALLQWSWNSDRAMPRKIKSLRSQLQLLEEQCQRDVVDQLTVSTRNKTRTDLNLLLQQEELYRRQRSRVSWLKDGDRNTKFFHASASRRQPINSISCLKDDTGAWVENESSLDTLAQQYFFTLFNYFISARKYNTGHTTCQQSGQPRYE
jgi:hypothetical protein